jgi:hypothetical protein
VRGWCVQDGRGTAPPGRNQLVCAGVSMEMRSLLRGVMGRLSGVLAMILAALLLLPTMAFAKGPSEAVIKGPASYPPLCAHQVQPPLDRL